MTPGNRTRLEAVVKILRDLSARPSDAQTAALTIITAQERLGIVLADLIFRPDVNS